MSRKLVLVMSLTIVLIGMLGVALKVQRVEAGGTFTIKVDGSVDPPTANITSVDNVTYTFAGNIYDEIVVERSNIIIDGAGYTVEGTGAWKSKGIALSGIVNVTIKNTNIKRFYYGVWLYESSNNSICGNNIRNNEYPIGLHYSNYNSISGNNIAINWYGSELEGSSNNSISGNNITANAHDGIWLYGSSNCNSISGNNIANNGVGVWLEGYSNYNSIPGNNITNNGVGIMLRRSSNNSISGNNMTNNSEGIRLDSWLDYSSNNSILANTFLNDGLFVYGSYGSVVEDNVVNGKPLVYLEGVTDYRVEDAGQVILVNCDGIVVEDLNLSNTAVGVQLWNTSNTKIANNIVANNEYGVWLYGSPNYNSISGNNIANNRYGIRLDKSSNNSISGNTITANNEYGISLHSSSYNVIYHNNFINNTQQVYSYGSVNVWDDGAGKGNYWSDYEERYPNATEIDNSGIWDTPYEIDENNQDNYPLMSRLGPLPPPFWMHWWFWAIVAVVIVALAGAVYFLKKRKPPTPTAPPLPTEGN